jgi:molybdopterin synthase sulfur carrier subunit
MAAVVRVLYFGIAREVTGKASEEYTAEDTISLKSQLLENYPQMKNIFFRLALNRSLIKSEETLKDNDIVAILPPFSGG